MESSKSFFEYQTSAHLLVTDEDAADFLQSQFTNDLRPFEAGGCVYGLWLDVKGKVLGDSWILCEGPEQFRVLSESSDGDRIRAHLEKHIIADDVEIEGCDAQVVFEFPAELLSEIGLQAVEPGKFQQTELGIVAYGRAGLVQIIAESSTANVVREAFQAAGIVEASVAERGLSRIARGIPQIPTEIGDTDLPGEGSLERDAISFTKGCYLGQEVVARMHNVGRPQRGVFVVDGVGGAPKVPLALYNGESKQVGELRSAYLNGKNWRGVAILKTRFAGEGETLRNEAIYVSVISPLREGT